MPLSGKLSDQGFIPVEYGDGRPSARRCLLIADA
jgi:hypothetical protein